MNKKETLKLRPGDIVIFGTHMQTQKVRNWLNGRVIKVTPRGGVLLRELREDGSEISGFPVWVPYSWIWRKNDYLI